MKHKTIHQEILLFVGTSFSSKEFCLKDPCSNETTDPFSTEYLRNASWAGMLSELLPELVDSTFAKTNTYIWHIVQGNHFFCINMGQCPAPLKKESSIDPYCFLPAVFNN